MVLDNNRLGIGLETKALDNQDVLAAGQIAEIKAAQFIGNAYLVNGKELNGSASDFYQIFTFHHHAVQGAAVHG